MLVALLFVSGCGGERETPRSEAPEPPVTVELAPFDRFPAHGKFPLNFRFSQPVAPAVRDNPANFETVQIAPGVNGWWSWASDSDLRFAPNDPWRPKESFTFNLNGLVTAGGTFGASAEFGPRSFTVKLPDPAARVASCELVLKNRAPVIQAPKIVLGLNYVPKREEILNFAEAKLTTGSEQELLPLTLGAGGQETAVVLEGPPIFRPEARSTVTFTLRPGLPLVPQGTLDEGAGCELVLDPERWDDALKLEEAARAKPLVEPAGYIAARSPGQLGPNRDPLQIRFLDSRTKREVEHGKPRASAVTAGLMMEPAIEGEWKADPYSDTRLNFVPRGEWPVGEVVKVSIDPAEFPALRFTNPSAEVRTPVLQLRIAPFDLAHVSAPGRRVMVARIAATHPLDEARLHEAVSLRVRQEPEKSFQGPGSRPVQFKVLRDEKIPLVYYVTSEPVDLPEEPGQALVVVREGLQSSAGGAPTNASYSATVAVPSKREIFRVVSSNLSIVTKEDARAGSRMERVLSLELSEEIDGGALQSGLRVYLLPDCALKENEKLCRERDAFGSEGAVLPEALERSSLVSVAALPRDEATLPNLHHFAVQAPENRELLVTLEAGLTSRDGFTLSKQYRAVFYTEEFPRTLEILHEGSLLSLTGSKKLGIAVRNVEQVEYELSRILPADVAHLVSVTSGRFADASFVDSWIALSQISERFTYRERFPDRAPGATSYGAVDFSRFMAQGAAPRGLFVLSVRDVPIEDSCQEDECETEYRAPLTDRRLVLLTDLGLLVKDSLSGEHDVFVLSFKSGAPSAGATVKLHGQNGLPIFTAVTDAQGRVTFPRTDELKHDKVPLYYSVERGGDFSFLPFRRYDRLQNASRFDTGGVYDGWEAEGLRAMVFSDRGIYRPGEEARFGIIVRRRNLEPAPAELTFEVGITDPRGIEILRRRFELSDAGFEEFKWSTEGVLTGSYTLGVYLVRDRRRNDIPLLGSVSYRLDEFQPDKLAVKARYATASGGHALAPGWNPHDGSFDVEVANLFGIPAVKSKVAGTLLVRPWDGVLPVFPGYRFYSRRSTREFPESAESLGDQATDEQGHARFVPDLTRFDEDAFRLDFAAEAFEKDSGRAVVSSTSVLVSKAAHFVGWKADGALDFVMKGSERKIRLKAVGPDLEPLAVPDLAAELQETRNVSVLVKKPDGTFRYELTPKSSIVWSKEISIPVEGAELALDTGNAGSFTLLLSDASGRRVATVPYLVMGEGNSTFLTDRSVEVGIQLDKISVEPDEELEISLNTPYAGTGLITIERERVYAAKWFRSDTNSSVQRIRVPRGIVGNAYVVVSFVRSSQSRDIYAPPLSFGVKPFSIARSEYEAKVALEVPEKVRPGEAIPVAYRLSSPGTLVVYAVDEGILQFARYRNPEPVTNFVPKRALEVQTFQIFDLLLPDYKIVSELSSPGGDEDVGLGKFKNPFARKRRAPMAFWSGLIRAEKTAGTIDVPVPDYFNGTVRIIGVLAADAKLGAATAKTIAQSEIVIDPQLPYFVSPGDEFEIGATVANAIEGSGAGAEIVMEILPAEGLERVSSEPVSLVVPEGEDRAFRVKVRAAQSGLGERELTIVARHGERQARASETVSVRPPRVFRTELQGGVHAGRPNEAGAHEVSPKRVLFPEMRDVQASISRTPLSIGRSLLSYLKSYPYGCTEQLVSTAFPAVIFGSDAELGLSAEDAHRLVSRALRALALRQLSDGSFGSWDAASEPDRLFSVYAAHFLLEARERGYEVSDVVFDRVSEWLAELTSATEYEPVPQLAQSYALYLRARLGETVTTEARRLTAELDRQWKQRWRESATALFLAATFKLLHLDDEASRLLVKPPRVWRPHFAWPLSDPAFFGSVYALVSTAHFDEAERLTPLDLALAVGNMIEAREFNSFNASVALQALAAYSETPLSTPANPLRVTAAGEGGVAGELALEGERILHAAVPAGTSSLTFAGPPGESFFFELSESGFDSLPPQGFANGIEIVRELRNQRGEAVQKLALADKLEVTMFIKADEALDRVAAVELVPGGFEIDLADESLARRESLRPGPDAWTPDYIDIQEDRLLFFGDLPAGTVSFTYRLKPLSRGKFTVPAPYAEAMYDTKKRFLGKESLIEVE